MSHGGAAVLADQLIVIADDTLRAAMFAEGEYIPQLNREDELRKAFSGAGSAAARLEHSKLRLARLECGEHTMHILQAAIDELEAGRSALQEGVAVTTDMLQNGVVVIDGVATGTAAQHFREAATIIRGIADIATLEATPCEALFRRITAG